MKEILISVIIPVYNSEKYLDRCINSVLEQGVDACEIICVDDGSDDGSPDILDGYSAKYPFVHVLHQENRHAGVARNEGLKIATGKYIHFVDADDYLFPDFYKKFLNAVKDVECDYIKIRAVAFDVNTGEFVNNAGYQMDMLTEGMWGKCLDPAKCMDTLLKCSCTPWSALVKRAFMLDKGILFNDLLCANDRSAYMNILCTASSVCFLDIFGVYHQVNNNDSLIKDRVKKFECHLHSYELVDEITKNVSKTIRKKIMNAEIASIASWFFMMDQEGKKKWEKDVCALLKNVDSSDLPPVVYDLLYFLNASDELEMNSLKDIKRIDNRESLKDFLLKCQKPICLYGAGIAAKAFLYVNRDVLERFSYIYVSDVVDNPTELFGIPVKQIQEKERDEAIIVSTRPIYQFGIFKDLNKKNYKDIIFLTDDYCQTCIETSRDRY